MGLLQLRNRVEQAIRAMREIGKCVPQRPAMTASSIHTASEYQLDKPREKHKQTGTFRW